MNPNILNDDALAKARKYCSLQERCVLQVLKKMGEWGIGEMDRDLIIEQLKNENYINEDRYAKAYASYQFRQNRWGKFKIRYELKKMQLSDSLIQAGLDEIDEEEYFLTLEKIIVKKKSEIKKKDLYAARKKVASFAISKGYENEMVWEIVRRIFD